MSISKEQAVEILSLAGFCDAESQLGCSAAIMDLLEAIVVAYPDLLDADIYTYQSVANLNWYLTLPREKQILRRAERPKRPSGWWKPDVTIEGLPAE